jgi:hypothetical protein
MRDLEVDIPVIGVPARQAFADVLLHFPFVVLTFLEPPEPFGPGRHVLHQSFVGEVLVAVYDDLADGDPFTFLDVEDDPNLSGLLG